MLPVEEQLLRMWRRLARENALLLGLLAEGRSLYEAEQALRAADACSACGLRAPARRASRHWPPRAPAL